jgi:hypothetical protein
MGQSSPSESKLFQRRNPLAMKTAATKTVKPPTKYIKDFRDAQKTLKDLELDLRKLKRKLDAFCQNPQIPAPPPPKK